MNNPGGEALEALKSRLFSIKKAHNYDFDIQSIILNESQPTLNMAAVDLPLIEIVNDGDDYEHDSSGSYWCETRVFLYMVAQKDYTDSQMELFKTNVIACLFGGTADATGNTGITLGGKITGMKLIGSASDLNMIESNRVYILKISLRSRRTTYRA